jgi:hypothetical protein
MIPYMAGFLGYGYGVMWQYGGLMMDKYDLFGYPQFGTDMMPNAMTLWSLLGLAGGSISVFCGLRRQHARNVIFVGAIGGVLLLLSFSWLPSLMVLVGSFLFCFE